MKEGIIKFGLEKIREEITISASLLKQLNSIRNKLHKMSMIGEDENGIGYGNISIREPNSTSFFITASQTGALETLNKIHISEVVSVDTKMHNLKFCGMQPSSESISHFSIYNSCPEINAVIHIHHKELWEKLYHNHPHFTPRNIEYGSNEMSVSISEVATKCGNDKIILMRGHENGIISFGKNLEEALRQLMDLHTTK